LLGGFRSCCAALQPILLLQHCRKQQQLWRLLPLMSLKGLDQPQQQMGRCMLLCSCSSQALSRQQQQQQWLLLMAAAAACSAGMGQPVTAAAAAAAVWVLSLPL
jgi:hypothetical protein